MKLKNSITGKISVENSVATTISKESTILKDMTKNRRREMRQKVNVTLLEKAIGKYYEDQKKKYHIAPTMCEGTHGEATSDGLIEKVLSAGRTLEEVIALERSILMELRPNIQYKEGMRLE